MIGPDLVALKSFFFRFHVSWLLAARIFQVFFQRCNPWIHEKDLEILEELRALHLEPGPGTRASKINTKKKTNERKGLLVFFSENEQIQFDEKGVEKEEVLLPHCSCFEGFVTGEHGSNKASNGRLLGRIWEKTFQRQKEIYNHEMLKKKIEKKSKNTLGKAGEAANSLRFQVGDRVEFGNSVRGNCDPKTEKETERRNDDQLLRGAMWIAFSLAPWWSFGIMSLVGRRKSECLTRQKSVLENPGDKQTKRIEHLNTFQHWHSKGNLLITFVGLFIFFENVGRWSWTVEWPSMHLWTVMSASARLKASDADFCHFSCPQFSRFSFSFL